MDAGSLDRRVSILRRQGATDDGYTTLPGTYGPAFTRWCSVKPKMGSEMVQAQGREGVAVMSFWFRHDSETATISTTDALDFNGQTYEIIAPPIEIGRRERIEVLGVAGSLPE